MRRRNGRRAAFTLIEILVVVAIIGLLVTLLIPAVQSARESARRARCVNNLKQIGIALEGHVQAFGSYPAGSDLRYRNGSYLVAILPFVEQQALFNSINFTDDDAVTLVNNNNQTVDHLIPATFVCPSEPANPFHSFKRTNYAGNGGFAAAEGVLISPVPLSGPPLSPRDIADGLSQTASVAEWRAGSGTKANPDPLSSIYLLIGGDLLKDCEGRRFTTAQVSYPAEKGWHWLGPGFGRTQYNHMLPPNRPSCALSRSLDSAVTAGSYHPGGANVLCLDGGVHFVRDAVDRAVWRAIGTSASGDFADWSSSL